MLNSCLKHFLYEQHMAMLSTVINQSTHESIVNWRYCTVSVKTKNAQLDRFWARHPLWHSSSVCPPPTSENDTACCAAMVGSHLSCFDRPQNQYSVLEPTNNCVNHQLCAAWTHSTNNGTDLWIVDTSVKTSINAWLAEGAPLGSCVGTCPWATRHM